MKQFEPYFALLDGYAFATPQDRENALWAALWASQARNSKDEIMSPFRPPLVVIEGNSGDRQRLASELNKLAGQDGKRSGPPKGNDLDMIAGLWLSIAWFDGVSRINGGMSQRLSHFISAEKWTFRLRGMQKSRTVGLYCLTVLTGVKVELSQDLMRRAVFIRLVSGSKFGPAVDVRGVMEERVLYASGSLEPICKDVGARRFMVAKKAVKKAKGGKKL